MTLKRHRESVHEGIRYPCEECDHRASTTWKLRAHIKKKHGDGINSYTPEHDSTPSQLIVTPQFTHIVAKKSEATPRDLVINSLYPVEDEIADSVILK